MFIMSKSIRFAHLADLHLGGWREKNLTHLNFITFKLAIQKVIDEKVDFVIFAGDIFNNALPPIELVNSVVKELMKLKHHKIPLYVIGGSHDYSFTGKSYIDLLESAHVLIDVSKYKLVDKEKIALEFFKDNSGANISGILGKKNGLDKNIYSNLNSHTLSKENFNIFVFHTTLDDIKPEFLKHSKSEVNSSYLPVGFDYYAGGHVHTHIEKKIGEKSTLSYPGPLFPNNFLEMKNEQPSFNLCEFDFETRDTKIKRVYLKTYEKVHIKIELSENINPTLAKSQIYENISKFDIKEKIVLLEIIGIIDGKISDINLNEIVAKTYQNGAFQILKNTYKLTTNTTLKPEINIENDSVENIETALLSKYLSEDSEQKHLQIMRKMLKEEFSKIDGEKISQFEERVIKSIEKSLN